MSKFFEFNDDHNLGLNYNEEYVPEHIRAGITNYFELGLHPGGFVSAVVANDLLRAVQSADHENRKHIPSITRWISYNAPAASRGSWAAFDNWIDDADGVRSKWLAQAERELIWRTLSQDLTPNGS